MYFKYLKFYIASIETTKPRVLGLFLILEYVVYVNVCIGALCFFKVLLIAKSGHG